MAENYSSRLTRDEVESLNRELKKLCKCYLDGELSQNKYERERESLLILSGVKWVDGG